MDILSCGENSSANENSVQKFYSIARRLSFWRGGAMKSSILEANEREEKTSQIKID